MIKYFICFIYYLSACLLIIHCLHDPAAGQTSPIVFNDNAGWCWYQDERVIINNNKLIIGSIADASGTGGASATAMSK